MNISPSTYSKSSADANAIGLQASAKMRRQDFEKVEQSLESGDLAAARKVVTAIKETQKIATKAQEARPVPLREAQVAQKIEKLDKALESGNIPEAKRALEQLKPDSRPERGAEVGSSSPEVIEREIVEKEAIKDSVPPPVPELSAKDKKVGTVLNALA